jgi:hypothetical protein
MDAFSKLTPPNAIRIRVEIITDKETNEFVHRLRPRSSHITDISTDYDSRERETALVSEQIIATLTESITPHIPFLLAPNAKTTTSANTSENRKQRVSLPTPITQEQQRKLIEQQQQQHQKKSNYIPFCLLVQI